MSKKIIFILFIALSLILTGCQNKDDFYNENGKLKIVTTLFPQYDFSKKIGGDKVDVKLLLKPGVESHSFNPTPTDIINISTKADLFIYTNVENEPWIEKFLNSIKGDVKVINSSTGIQMIEAAHDEEEEEEEEHEEEGLDPHVWLDPIHALVMVDNVLKGLIEVDPENKAYYEANAEILKGEINELHNDFISLFDQIPQEERIIIHGGHFVFGYFAVRYGVQYTSPYSGFSPNAEPTPTKIAELVKLINETNQKYIYSEELVEPRVANVISRETGASILVLHGVHNVSSEEVKNNVSYVSLMRQNLENLKIGFNKQ